MLDTTSVTPKDFPDPGVPNTEIESGRTVFFAERYSEIRFLMLLYPSISALSTVFRFLKCAIGINLSALFSPFLTIS